MEADRRAWYSRSTPSCRNSEGHRAGGELASHTGPGHPPDVRRMHRRIRPRADQSRDRSPVCSGVRFRSVPSSSALLRGLHRCRVDEAEETGLVGALPSGVAPSAGPDFVAPLATLEPLPEQGAGVAETVATQAADELPQVHAKAEPIGVSA
jgi:hypothetical protein